MLTPLVAAEAGWIATVKVLVLDQFGEPVANHRVTFSVSGTAQFSEGCEQEALDWADQLIAERIVTMPDTYSCEPDAFERDAYTDSKGVAAFTYSRSELGQDVVEVWKGGPALVTWSSQSQSVEVPSEAPTPGTLPSPTPPDPTAPTPTHYVMLTPAVVAQTYRNATVKVLVLDQFGEPVTNHKITFLVTGTTEVTQNCVQQPLDSAAELIIKAPDTYYCPRDFFYLDAYTDSKGVATTSYSRETEGQDIVSAGGGKASVTWNWSEEATIEVPVPQPLPSPTAPSPEPLPSPTAPTPGPLPSPEPLPSPTAPTPGPLPSPEPLPSPTAPTPGPLPSPSPTGGSTDTCDLETDSVYTCAGTAFRWLEPSATPLGLGPEVASDPIDIPFPFTWYGQAKTHLQVSDNGFVCFTTSSECGSRRAQRLPDAGVPNDVAACFWEDLSPSDGGSVSYGVVGELPRRTMVLEFDAVPHLDSTTSNSFQVHINEDGSFDCMLKDVANDDDGASSVVGIEDSTGELGTRYRFGEFSAQNVGISFKPIGVSE
jgi:hypothetical protein